MLLSASTLGLVSCSSLDNTSPTAVISPPDNPHNNLKERPLPRTAEWQDAGELHNSICREVDDATATAGIPGEFTTAEDYHEWVIDEVVRDYVVTELGVMSSGQYNTLAEAYWESDLEDFEFSQSQYAALLAYQVSIAAITQRESDFMMRWKNIIMLIDDEISMTVITDSLDDWKDDILNITWESSEATIVPFMSVAYQSFDFWLNEGFDDTDPNYDGEDVVRDDDPRSPEEIDATARHIEYIWAIMNGYNVWEAEIIANIYAAMQSMRAAMEMTIDNWW